MSEARSAVDIATLLHPLRLQGWIESLPYADFQRPSRLIETAIRQTNTQPVKPVVRFELMRLYFQAYLYLLGTYIKPKATAGPQSLDTLQQQIEVQKRIVGEIAAGYRQAVRESLATRSVFQSGRPSAEGLFLAVKAHVHWLVMHFQSYTPVTKSLWQDLHNLYLLAEQLGETQKPVADPERDPPATATLGEVYRQGLATATADPPHLPFGAVWEIHGQLNDWVADTHLYKFNPVPQPAGYFVVDLKSSEGPVSYSKFRLDRPTEQLRLLDFRALHRTARQRLDLLEKGRPLREVARFSPNQARHLLEHLVRTWGLPPARALPRQVKQGAVNITCGVYAIYFHLNKGIDFSYTLNPVTSHGIDVAGAGTDADAETATPGYPTENWKFYNESAGGYSIYTLSNSKLPVRVGELVGLRTPDGKPADDWILGAIRWLIQASDQSYRIGVQIIGNDPQPAALRSLDAGTGETRFQRGFLIRSVTAGNQPALVTSRGLFKAGRPVETEIGSERSRISLAALVESTTVFETFSFVSG